MKIVESVPTFDRCPDCGAMYIHLLRINSKYLVRCGRCKTYPSKQKYSTLDKAIAGWKRYSTVCQKIDGEIKESVLPK